MPYLLVLLTILVYFLNFWSFQVWSPNEAFYADASRYMLETKNLVTPYYNGEIRLNKPPMTYWIVALGYSIFGVNELGLRFMHVLLGLLTGVVTALLAWEVFKSKTISTYSFIIFSLSLTIYANAHYASPEMPFTFFITLSIYLWYVGYIRKNNFFIVFAFLAASLAMLVKGPAGFVLPAGVVFLYLLVANPSELLKLKYYLLSFVSLILGLWWHVYQIFDKGKLFWEIFYKENFKRIYSGGEPFYFYYLDLLVSFLPYSFLFFFALFWVVFKQRQNHFIFLAWFFFIFTLFSVVKQKIPVYVMPAYPALAVMTAGFLVSSSWEKLKRYSSYFLSIFISLVCLILIFYFNLDFKFLLLFLFLPFFLWKYTKLAPAYAMVMFLLVFNLGLLPWLENYRHYKDVGSFIRSLDPQGRVETYQVGHFNHNLPFYAQRKIIRNQEPQKGSIVIYKEGSFLECEPLKTFRLYTGSESRLLRFIQDTKKGKNFHDFHICIYE